MIKEFNDKIFFDDTTTGKKSGFWARTEIVMGYGDIHDNPNGKSSMDEVIFTGSNMVTIGGVQYAMEKIFGVSGSLDIKSKSLHDTQECEGTGTTNIGPENSNPIPYTKKEWNYKAEAGTTTSLTKENYDKLVDFSANTYEIPYTPPKTVDEETSADIPIGVNVYRNGHVVQLFGIGRSGITTNDTTVYPVDYRDTGIEMNHSYDSSRDITGHMLPFRQTADELSESDALKYFGKKQEEVSGSTFTSYYLKRFESTPTIKHVYASGVDADYDDLLNQDSISADDIWNYNNNDTNTIETFTEMQLKISSKDLKEYFLHLEQEDVARFNTIALFAGKYVEEYKDYQDVIMFSKLIIPLEYVSLNKDLNIIYRVYGS